MSVKVARESYRLCTRNAQELTTIPAVRCSCIEWFSRESVLLDHSSRLSSVEKRPEPNKWIKRFLQFRTANLAPDLTNVAYYHNNRCSILQVVYPYLWYFSTYENKVLKRIKTVSLQNVTSQAKKHRVQSTNWFGKKWIKAMIYFEGFHLGIFSVTGSPIPHCKKPDFCWHTHSTWKKRYSL